MKIEFSEKFQEIVEKELFGIPVKIKPLTAKERAMFIEMAMDTESNPTKKTLKTFNKNANKILLNHVVDITFPFKIDGKPREFKTLTDKEKLLYFESHPLSKFIDGLLGLIMDASTLSEDEVGFLGKRLRSGVRTRR